MQGPFRRRSLQPTSRPSGLRKSRSLIPRAEAHHPPDVHVDRPATLAVSASTVAPGALETVTARRMDSAARGLDRPGGGRCSEYEQPGVDLYRRQRDNPHVERDDAHDRRQLRVPLFLDNGYERAATSPRVVVDPALTPAPVITSLSPSRMIAGLASFTLTVTGSAFVPSSVVLWNGASRPTTFVSSTQIAAVIGAADILSIGAPRRWPSERRRPAAGRQLRWPSRSIRHPRSRSARRAFRPALPLP